MPRFAYVNGRYLRHEIAAVHIEERGFQFADGVYEVVTVQNGRMVDEDGHLARLKRSLGELEMAWPVGERALRLIMRQLVRRNRIRDGIVYLQITRGTAPRDFRFPDQATPTLVLTTRRMNLDPKALIDQGIAVITIPDIRWKRRDIKSVSLLPQVLGKQQAAAAGYSPPLLAHYLGAGRVLRVSRDLPTRPLPGRRVRGPDRGVDVIRARGRALPSDGVGAP